MHVVGCNTRWHSVRGTCVLSVEYLQMFFFSVRLFPSLITFLLANTMKSSEFKTGAERNDAVLYTLPCGINCMEESKVDQ